MARQAQLPLLVDQFGRPLSYGNFYESADRFRDGDLTRAMFYNGAQDTDKLLPIDDWQSLMESGRSLFANAPLLKGAMLEQANYSFPLEPHWAGKDKDWGKLAKEWLYYWKKQSDVRGNPYDCHTASRLRLLGWKIDGDLATVLVNDDKQPRLQRIRAHRIGTRDADKDSRLRDGAWKGYRIKNGVVVNNFDRMLAICVLGEKKADDQFIPESPAQLAEYGGFLPVRMTYNPLLFDQTRGITSLEASIRSFEAHKRWHEAEMRAQQVVARETLIEWNDAGEFTPEPGDLDSDGVVVKRAGGQPTFVSMPGQTRYYRSGSGGKLELLRPDRPGPGVMAFDDKTISEAFYGIGWDPNFGLLIKNPTGANVRLIARKVNHTLQENQRIEAETQRWEDTWALSMAIKAGELPMPKNGDFTSWDYTGPARISADAANDEQAKREAYKIGLLTRRRYYGEMGWWEDEEDEQRFEETRSRLADAKKLQGEYPELTLMQCFELLEQRSPNPTATAGQGEDKAEKDEPPDPEQPDPNE
jgi:hypothetical protein